MAQMARVSRIRRVGQLERQKPSPVNLRSEFTKDALAWQGKNRLLRGAWGT
jgi:hypothetical protein